MATKHDDPEIKPKLEDAILMMIRAHVGKPCPTRKTIMEWTGLPRRLVWAVLHGMHCQGLIEIEKRVSKEAGKDPIRRRVRVAGEEWTEWTARRPVTEMYSGRRADGMMRTT